MTYRSDRRGETPEKPWPLEAVYPVGTPRANFIMARNSNVPFERPKIRMQSICHSTRKSNIRMLKRIFGKRIWDSCAYLTGGVQIRLLDQLDAPVTGFLADGAYDGASTRDLLRERYGETLDVVIPPPKNAVIRTVTDRVVTDRDRHIAQIRSNGRMAWQLATGYNQRSRIETQIGRWKSVIGPKLKSRSFSRQITEIQVGQKVLNTMTALGRPVFERIA